MAAPRGSLRRIRALAGGVALFAFAFATSIVDAKRAPPSQPRQEEPMQPYYCPEPWLPEANQASHGYAGAGGMWGIHPPVDAVDLRCEYVSGERRVAVDLTHYPARADSHGHRGWTWFQTVEPLDAAVDWGLECEWLPAGCTAQTCPEQAQHTAFGIRPIIAPRDPAVAEIAFVDPILEQESCSGLGPRLRLQTRATFDWGFWGDGGVLRVGYADGTWSVTGPDPDAPTEGAMTTVPAPARGDPWFGVEVVRGDGVVLEAVRFEPEARLWDEVSVVDRGYGGTGRYEPPAYEEPRAQGCKRR